MSSLRQIASIAGVSSSTVSRALNDDPAVHARTRAKVLAAANKSGYVASIGRRVTTNVALAYCDGQTLGSTYDSALISGIVDGLDEARFDIVILKLQRDKGSEETYSQFFRRKGVRGVLLRATSTSRHVAEAIADEGFPMIVLSERFDNKRVSFIGYASRQESTRAVEYLISLGHRRIAFAMSNVPDCDHLDRLEGYKAGLSEHGIPIDERLILRQKADFAGGMSALGLVSRMPNRPTAVFFADPCLAVGALNSAPELGIRVPEDISIIGVDDADLRFSVQPTLTAVCQDVTRLGFEAAARLTRSIIGNEEDQCRKLLPTFLEINKSTDVVPPESVKSGNNGSTRPGMSPGTAEVN